MSGKKKHAVTGNENGYKTDILAPRDTNLTNGKETKQRAKETAALEKFKARVSDLIKPEHDDYFLEKWLKARCYDVEKAVQMFRASMAYREKMRVDTLLDEYKTPEVIEKYLTGGFCGHARDGSPVRVELYGRLDIKGLMSSVKKSDLEKAKLRQCEWTVVDWQRESQKRGYRVDGLTVIFDMEGVGTRMLWRPGIQMYLHMVKVLEDNYPEMMRRLLVINAPRIFPVLYKLVRPLISEDMKNKIHILAGNYSETLKKYIDDDNLPACYGGKLTDPDGNPRCVTMICQGGDVPEKYYFQNSDLLSHMTKVSVPRGDKLMFDYQVEKAGSILRWEFKTEDYDIGFGVFYSSDKNTLPVIPVSRVNSHLVAEDGSWTCEREGTYYLCFDNTFSWTKNKTVYYTCEVIRTDDTDIRSEISQLIEEGNWQTLSEKFETTHL